MVNYDTPSVLGLLSGYSASDWTTFANDCSSNWVNAWTSRFLMAPPYLDAITNTTPLRKQAFIIALQQNALDVIAGNPIDFSGFDIGTVATGQTTWSLHIDFTWLGVFPSATSFWWTHKP